MNNVYHRALNDDHQGLARELAGNVNIDERSPSGSTPLHAAAAAGSVRCLQMLLKRGYDPAVEDENGRTALDMAMGGDTTRHKGCYNRLLAFEEGEADPDDYRNRSRSPLMDAILSRQTLKAQAIVDSIKDDWVALEHRDFMGWSALVHAATVSPPHPLPEGAPDLAGDPAVFKALLRAGARIDVVTSGGPAFPRLPNSRVHPVHPVITDALERLLKKRYFRCPANFKFLDDDDPKPPKRNAPAQPQEETMNALKHAARNGLIGKVKAALPQATDAERTEAIRAVIDRIDALAAPGPSGAPAGKVKLEAKLRTILNILRSDRYEGELGTCTDAGLDHALSEAVAFHDPEGTERLLQKGARARQESRDDEPAMHERLEARIEKLIDRGGPCVDRPDKLVNALKTLAALRHADESLDSGHDSWDVANAALWAAAGGYVARPSDRGTGSWKMSPAWSMHVARAALDAGAHAWSQHGEFGENCVHRAAARGDARLLEAMLASGPTELATLPDCNGDFPIHHAVRARSVATIKVLLEMTDDGLEWEGAADLTPHALAESMLEDELAHEGTEAGIRAASRRWGPVLRAVAVA